MTPDIYNMLERYIKNHSSLAFFLAFVLFLLPAQGCAQNKTPDAPYSTASQGTSILPAKPALSVFVTQETFNGQTVLLKVSSPSLEQVSLRWGKETLVITPAPGEHGLLEAMALLPVGLDARPEVRKLELLIKDAGKEINQSVDVRISKKKYPEQQLKVDPKFVSLSDADLKRHQKERKRVEKVLAARGDERYWELPFVNPVPGKVTSLFGVARMFNGVPRSSHKGLDLSGVTGTPIKACADGKVVLADNLFFSGNVVYIDHGLGVFTMYCHMSEILVKEGSFVHAGEVIGKVGATGRVTGPHLHLSVIVMGTSVDPETLLKPAVGSARDEISSPTASTGAK